MSQISVKERSDAAVQGTNDSSIVSKCSMAAQGYFQDDYLKLFVSSPKSRRAPLINRGYYIRARIIDDVLQRFLTQFSTMEKQIVSLGAGFDSAFFRLEASGCLDNKIRFIEVDFPQVAERKTSLIDANPELKACVVDDATGCQPSEGVFIASKKYYLLGVDLCDLDRLQEGLLQCGIDRDVPTLLLSECVITYMDVSSSNKVIQWALKIFQNSIFVSYEQIQPDDAFGIVMQNHFKKLNSPIKAIQTYPTLNAHCQRYLSMGWPCCHAVNMNQYYMGALSQQERTRIEALELFDEFEEWHLKCAHYMVACASSGICEHSLAELFAFKETNQEDAPSTNAKPGTQHTKTIQLKQLNSTSSARIRCFSHAIARVTSNCVLLYGGFGETSNRRHSRLNCVRLLNITEGTLVTVLPKSDDSTLDARLHHTMNAISNSRWIIFGGRTSPAKPCSSTIILSLEQEGDILYYQCNVIPSSSSGTVPTPRWRHTASVLRSCDQGDDRLIVHGGCTTARQVLGDIWMMEIDKGIWEKVQLSGDTPKPRHSHTMSCWQEDKLIIAGGLTDDLRPLNSVYVIDTKSWECRSLCLTPSASPRYSHTDYISGDNLILIGGVNPLSSTPPPLVIINLIDATWKQYAMPVADPENPIMLHNHSSVLLSDSRILLLGGGGNCFSFGTHLNQSPVELTLDLNS